MKKLISISFIIGALSAPVLSFAQSSTGLTRAQVVADLVRLEKAGYSPSAGDESKYPADIQAAEAKVAAEDAAAKAPATADGSGTSSETADQR